MVQTSANMSIKYRSKVPIQILPDIKELLTSIPKINCLSCGINNKEVS